MLVPFLIMLREGLEAALIVGIVASYLRQTGRAQWLPAVWVGIFLAVALSLFVGAGLQFVSAEFPQKLQELFEAVVGFIAAGVLMSMVLWMRKAARNISSELRASVDAAFAQPGSKAYGLIAMVFIAVAREGVESVFFLLATFQQSASAGGPLGALLGVLVAVAVGYGIYAGGIRLNLKHFFRWTGVFILFVAAGIMSNSVLALHEAGIWNYAQTVVFDFSSVLPVGSPAGTLFAGILGYQDTPSISVVVAYLVFLITTLFLFLRPVTMTGVPVGNVQK